MTLLRCRIVSAVIAPLLIASATLAHGPPVDREVIPSDPQEAWWGGLSVDGALMPYSSGQSFSRDLFGSNRGNQAQPLLISSDGRYVWCEQPIAYEFGGGNVVVTSAHSEVNLGKAGTTLRDAFLHASRNFFPPDGELPDPLLFSHPQYNTWIELMYDQNQEDILAYARAVVDSGYHPGVLMIDDNWQESYGDWRFESRRFPAPKEMIDELHQMGFKVMLWVCPFVTSDTETFRHLEKEKLVLLESNGKQDMLWATNSNKAAIVRWWNGASAVLDLTNPAARDWFIRQLDHLVDEYGVDGFKFDAGDARFYREGMVSHRLCLPNDHTERFASLGLRYPLNEFRASWKLAGRPLAQRLRDKTHSWEDLQQLVPGIIAQGLMGYAFTCPDMIGGGEYQSFLKTSTVDQELVVRSAQCSALMPMMQFSVAPWRVLSAENNRRCREMAELHSQMGEEILDLARAASRDGEPIVRCLEYEYPGQGYEKIKNQFLLGRDVLVAPVLESGSRRREVVFPPGDWAGDDGSRVVGPSTRFVDAGLDRLPWYRRIEHPE